jgi:hypothetical protein
MRSLLCAALAASAAAQASWTVYSNYDAPSEDIKQYSGASVDQLKQYCLTTPGCVAFNTDGA